jgi:outer membrane protein assembly factor BamB
MEESPISYGVSALNSETVVLWIGGPARGYEGVALDDLSPTWVERRTAIHWVGLDGDDLIFLHKPGLLTLSMRGEAVGSAPFRREGVMRREYGIRPRWGRAYFRQEARDSGTIWAAVDVGAEFGRELWRRTDENVIAFRYATYDLGVLLPDTDKSCVVEAIELETAHTRWKLQVENGLEGIDLEGISSTESGERLLFSLKRTTERRGSYEILAVDRESGAPIWRGPVLPGHLRECLVTQKTVVCVGWAGPAFALDASTGVQVWKSRSHPWGARVDVGGEVVVTLVRDAIEVVALEAETGRERWRRPIPSRRESFDDALEVNGGTAYVASANDEGRVTLVAVDLPDGRLRFESSADVGPFDSVNPIDFDIALQLLENEVVVLAPNVGRLALARFAD